MVAAISLAALVALNPAGAATATTTVAIAADAYVAQNQPSRNFGGDTRLKVSSSPLLRTYLRFSIQGLSGTVVSVTLRVNSISSSSVPVSVFGVADTSWGEQTITYNNAPQPAASATSSSGSFASKQWVSFDVTPLIVGNGLVSFALATTSTTAISFNSREAGSATAPQLVITTTSARL